jgi:hypothetical protein
VEHECYLALWESKPQDGRQREPVKESEGVTPFRPTYEAGRTISAKTRRPRSKMAHSEITSGEEDDEVLQNQNVKIDASQQRQHVHYTPVHPTATRPHLSRVSNRRVSLYPGKKDLARLQSKLLFQYPPQVPKKASTCLLREFHRGQEVKRRRLEAKVNNVNN